MSQQFGEFHDAAGDTREKRKTRVFFAFTYVAQQT